MTTATLPKRADLPKELTWELEAIYATDADWEHDFAQVTAKLPELTSQQGHLGESAPHLLGALRLRDDVSQVLERLFVYATMRLHENTANATYQALTDRATSLINDVRAATAFYTPEILSIPEERLMAMVAEDDGLRLYRHALDEIGRERPHVLSPEMEALLAQASELGNAPERIYEMLDYADLKLPVLRDEHDNQVQLTQGNYGPRFLENRDRRVRKDAFEAMLGTYQGYRNTIGATLASHVKRDLFFAKARRYPTALDAALYPNNIPTAVYATLIETVHHNIPTLQRYLSLRKRVLGVDELHMYDLYVPLVAEVEYKASFDEARDTVAKALAPLGERYVVDLREGLTSRWIDVPENEGKRSGAYSWGSYGTHPFVLLNFQESLDNVFTLAHEMGHAMHSHFTWSTQPYPYGSYTIFLAEVASTLNEALLTHYLLRTTQDRALRLYVINHYLEGFRTTLYRQTLFAEFEQAIHTRAESGEALTPDLLCAVYKELNDRYYAPAVAVDDLIAIEWARIPHFYSTYYVYQYATGISASAALAQQIITEGQPAVDRYLTFLSSGSSDYSINLLRAAGVDMSTPAPVQQALDIFARYLDEMEQLI